MSEKFIRVTSGPSAFEIVEIDNPAVGQDFSIILEEGYTYRILSCTFTLVASAIVATRQVIVKYCLADFLLAVMTIQGNQIASETLIYNFYSNAYSADHSGSSLNMVNHWPQRFFLPGGVRVHSDVHALDVGDQISDISLYLQKWPVLVL